MTQLERDVIEAAKAAVYIDHGPKVSTADLRKDPEVVGRLVRAVYRLQTDSGYWRES